MTLELLKQVKQAEDDAEAVLRQAHERASAIVKEAEQARAALAERMLSDARAQGKEYHAQKMAEADRRLEQLRKAHVTTLETVRRHASARMSKAVEVIVKRVVRDYGDR